MTHCAYGSLLATVAAMALFLGTQPAHAQAPKFAYADDKTRSELTAADADQANPVKWSASAQAGLILTRGNSQLTTLSAGALVSRKANRNQLQLEASFAYAESRIAQDVDGNGTIDNADELAGVAVPTSQAWLIKTRYDRFLSDNNALYITALVSADKLAGKDMVSGGQAGYSRLLWTNDRHELRSEVGYDVSYEKLTGGDGVLIHSVRALVGYDGKLGAETGVHSSVEGLFNANSITTAAGQAGAFADTRINAKLALTTKLFERLSFRFGIDARFDNFPAPLPAPAGLAYGDGFAPLAEKLDIKAEAALIFNVL